MTHLIRGCTDQVITAWIHNVAAINHNGSLLTDGTSIFSYVHFELATWVGNQVRLTTDVSPSKTTSSQRNKIKAAIQAAGIEAIL